MAFIIKDRVKESTTSTGTGAIALSGAAATFDTFQSYMTNGDTTYYAIVHTTSGVDEWEVGLGTWNTGNTLTRTTVLAGSNGASAENFSAGAKDVFMTYPAAHAALAGDDVNFANITVTGTVDGRDIAADGTKLDGIDTSADVTDATTVAAAGALMKSGGTMTGALILSADPSAALGAATKEYVDTIASSGLHYHDPVRVEHPSNINATYNNGSSGVGATLTNAGSNAAIQLDGVSLALNDRVLVANQTNEAHNGVYKVTTVGDGSTAWVLTRTVDADSYAPSDPDAFGKGDAFFIREGDTNAGHLDVLTTSGTITFGTTNIHFAEVAETAVYSAGTGVTLTGDVFSIGQAVGTSDSVTFNQVTAAIIGNVTGNVTGDVTGNADTATALATARTIQLTGDVTGSASFDGTANASITAVVQDDSHSHVISNVDGLQTALDAKAPTSRTITAGNGLTGGGNLTANRTLNVGAGSGITVTADAVAHADTSTQASVNNSGRTYIQDITLDGFGHITGLTSATETVTDTTYSAGSGLSLSGTTFSHTDTSSQASVDNSNGTVIQDITLDTYGHITGINSVNLDGRYYTETEADSLFVNVTGDTMSGDLTFGSGDNIHRSTHSSGYLVGSYNNVANNNSKTNPIYTIGSNYQPNDGDLVNMYGIGFTTGNAAYDGINSVLSGWGMYVASDGDARIGLDAQNGIIKSTGVAYVNTNQRVFADNYHPNADKWTTARTLSLSGDASGSVSWDGSANATLSVTVADDSHNHTWTNIDGGSVNPWGGLRHSTSSGYIDFGPANTSWAHIYTDRANFYFNKELYVNSNKVWNAGNDGSGSGLDADKLDGVQGSSYLRSDAADTATGALTLRNDNGLFIQSSTNAVGAKINFSDVTSGYAQVGTIDYRHSDGYWDSFSGLEAAGDGFHFKGTEANTAFYFEGNASVSGNLTISNATDEKIVLTGSSQPYIRWQEGTTDKAYIQWNSSGYLDFRNQETGNFKFQSSVDGQASQLFLVRNDTSTASGDDLGSINFGHTDGSPDWPTQTTSQMPARIVAEASETAGTGDDGARLRFFTKATNADKATDSIERMRIENNGYLEMYSRLDMNNNDIQGVDQIFHHGDTNTYMQFHAPDQWRVVTGGTERLEVNNTQITSAEPIHAPSFHGDGSALTGTGSSTTAGDVGTYAYLINTVGNIGITPGATTAGSSLRYSAQSSNSNTSSSGYSVGHTYSSGPSGTWQAMGGRTTTGSYTYAATLYVRIS